MLSVLRATKMCCFHALEKQRVMRATKMIMKLMKTIWVACVMRGATV